MGAYDEEIRDKAVEAADLETLFFELAIEDLPASGGLVQRRSIERTAGVDGWVSLEVSPLLAYDAARSVRAAADLHARGRAREPVHQDPGDRAKACRRSKRRTFAGVPVNVTLLFSPEQYLASADAYMRGIERRIEAGLDPKISSVASVFISRWDAAVIGPCARAAAQPGSGLAVGLKTYQSVSTANGFSYAGSVSRTPARVLQRLLWASTGTKDPTPPTRCTSTVLRAPHTINTMPESTLRAFDDHGRVGEPIAVDGGDAEATLAQFESAGVDVNALAARLQSEGARNFVKSWDDLLTRIDNQLAVVA